MSISPKEKIFINITIYHYQPRCKWLGTLQTHSLLLGGMSTIMIAITTICDYAMVINFTFFDTLHGYIYKPGFLAYMLIWDDYCFVLENESSQKMFLIKLKFIYTFERRFTQVSVSVHKKLSERETTGWLLFLLNVFPWREEKSKGMRGVQRSSKIIVKHFETLFIQPFLVGGTLSWGCQLYFRHFSFLYNFELYFVFFLVRKKFLQTQNGMGWSEVSVESENMF